MVHASHSQIIRANNELLEVLLAMIGPKWYTGVCFVLRYKWEAGHVENAKYRMLGQTREYKDVWGYWCQHSQLSNSLKIYVKTLCSSSALDMCSGITNLMVSPIEDKAFEMVWVSDASAGVGFDWRFTTDWWHKTLTLGSKGLQAETCFDGL